MSKPTLYLHIGIPKTGSSTLQTSLCLNKNKLAEKGIFSPEESIMASEFLYSLHVKYGARRLGRSLPDPEIYLSRYLKQFHNGNYNTMVISNEMYGIFTEHSDFDKIREWIKNQFSGFKINIVCYLRRQDLYIESLYNQFIRNNYSYWGTYFDNYSYEKSVKKLASSGYSIEKKKDISSFDFLFPGFFEYANFAQILSKWADVFGKENIMVIPFEKSQFKKGLVSDFYNNVLGLTQDDIAGFEQVGTINETVDRDLVEFIDASGIHDFQLFKCVNEFLNNKAINNVFFTNNERKKLLDFHKEGNEYIARSYLAREDGKLFYDPVKEYKPYGGLSIEKAEEIRKKILSIVKTMYINEVYDPIVKEDRELNSLEQVIESSKRIYYRRVDETYVKRSITFLIDPLVKQDKSVVIYGFFGVLANLILDVVVLYERCVRIYVADKKLAGIINVQYSNVLVNVIDLDGIKRLNPDIIIIAAAISGKAIKSELDGLELTKTDIYPAYDFSDSMWDLLARKKQKL